MPCAGWIWRSSKANASACSVPTAPARRRRSRFSKGCSTPRPARSKCSACTWGRHDDEIRQRIGISLQETRLSEKLTVRETLTLFRSFYRRGIEPDEAMAPGVARRESQLLGRQALRRPEAAAGGGLRTGRRSGAAVSRRADDGARSAIAAAAVGHHPRLSRSAAAPCCSPRTTWTRPSGCATAWPSSITGKVIAPGHAARADRQPRRRARDRIHAGNNRRRWLHSGERFARFANGDRRPRRETATSAFQSANRTSPCRRCWHGSNRSIAGSPD